MVTTPQEQTVQQILSQDYQDAIIEHAFINGPKLTRDASRFPFPPTRMTIHRPDIPIIFHSFGKLAGDYSLGTWGGFWFAPNRSTVYVYFCGEAGFNFPISTVFQQDKEEITELANVPRSDQEGRVETRMGKLGIIYAQLFLAPNIPTDDFETIINGHVKDAKETVKKAESHILAPFRRYEEDPVVGISQSVKALLKGFYDLVFRVASQYTLKESAEKTKQHIVENELQRFNDSHKDYSHRVKGFDLRHDLTDRYKQAIDGLQAAIREAMGQEELLRRLGDQGYAEYKRAEALKAYSASPSGSGPAVVRQESPLQWLYGQRDR